ncbi:FdtA/QdtA family cupin domain-containing protein [Nostoc sp. ChiQUE01b]|uniref:sugar 3,4-ketoisomerase n=1 Tax=Nostoc sp. ChiQUE01b TaxID=3075376 RepID=UPI002AD33646|nr:FdtA/QdtA family cupin domain-containing protein [Nostoc sp. ChiQUE01b]MDZ8257301.1 FdtA/QdtA family cupin domain-containing protein [Nostoc sp. ChiQUE01b]
MKVTGDLKENQTSIQQYRLIDLPKITDPRGNLTFVEANKHIPFEIKRVFYVYDVPIGAERAGHAHRKLQEFLVAISGSFDVKINDGYQEKKYHMSCSHSGLYLDSMIWCKIDNFSPGAVCMVLASDFYDESDYYRNYKDFIKAIKGRG